MEWEIAVSGISSRPYYIRPGREFRRFASGYDIRTFEEHAGNLIAEALVTRVSRLHRITVSALKASRRFVDSSCLEHTKAFALRQVREAIDTAGVDGLLRMVRDPFDQHADFGHATALCLLTSDLTLPATFGVGDRLARGFEGATIPSRKELTKATATLRTLDWSVAWGPNRHWILEPTRNFEKHRKGQEAQSPDQIARALIARTIHRMIPASTVAINARMRSFKDAEGAAVVRQDLCSAIDMAIRLYGYSGLLALAGVTKTTPIPVGADKCSALGPEGVLDGKVGYRPPPAR